MTLLRYWREALIAAAVLVAVGYCRARDRAIADTARAEVVYARADSTIRANAPKFARVDTLVVRDTVRVRETVARVTTLRDTVLRHLTDTVLIREYVTRSDSAANACTELAHDCAAFRTFAFGRFAQDSIKLATQPRIVAAKASRGLLPRPGFGVTAGIDAHGKPNIVGGISLQWRF